MDGAVKIKKKHQEEAGGGWFGRWGKIISVSFPHVSTCLTGF